MPRLSILTPAYDRADTLPRLHESLLEQDYADFEWVLVDDGSSDGTGELVRGWAEESPFPIRYSWQENQGKHVAVNRCVELAAGELCALIDSDDTYTPGALSEMVGVWDSIPAAARDGFANVEGLRTDFDGNPVGDRFPADVFDSDTFEIEALHGVRGDTVGMYRTDVLRRFPFPDDLGWHVTPSLIWNRIAARYRTRFVNRVWSLTGYAGGGLSDRETELRLRYPEAQLVYWDEYAAMPRRMTPRNRLRANANRCRYALHSRRFAIAAPWRSPTPLWALAALPAGSLLFLRDLWRSRRPGGAGR